MVDEGFSLASGFHSSPPASCPKCGAEFVPGEYLVERVVSNTGHNDFSGGMGLETERVHEDCGDSGK